MDDGTRFNGDVLGRGLAARGNASKQRAHARSESGSGSGRRRSDDDAEDEGDGADGVLEAALS
eukprot:3449045-Rhodomonas_salina.2